MPSLTTTPRPSSPAWSTSATCGHCAPDPEDLALLTTPTAATPQNLTPTESTSTAWSTGATCGPRASSRTITPSAASLDIFEPAPVPLRRQPKILRGVGGARAAGPEDVELEGGESPFVIWLVYEEFLKGEDGGEAEMGEVQGKGEGKGKEKEKEEKEGEEKAGEEGEKVDGDKGAQVRSGGERHIKWKSELPSAKGQRSKSADSGVAEGGLECKDGEPASGTAVDGTSAAGGEVGVRKTKKIAAVDANRMCRNSLRVGSRAEKI